MHYGFGKRQLHSIALSSERLGAAPLVTELTSAQIEFVGQRPAETVSHGDVLAANGSSNTMSWPRGGSQT